MAGQGVYHPTAEHDISIHSNKVNMQDMCVDQDEADIIISHVLMGTGRYWHGWIHYEYHREVGVSGIIYARIDSSS